MKDNKESNEPNDPMLLNEPMLLEMDGVRLEMMRKILFDTDYGYVNSNEQSDEDWIVIEKLIDSNHLECEISVMGGGYASFAIYPVEQCELELCEMYKKTIERCHTCNKQIVFDTDGGESIVCCDAIHTIGG